MSQVEIPDDIDALIIALNKKNPKLTINAIVRDIARIKMIFALLDKGFLNDKSVVCGGMALRCFKSTRFTIYDTDTSSKVAITPDELASAIYYEDDDIIIEPVEPEAWKDENQILTAAPIRFVPDFTGLPVTDPTFSLSVATRGLERNADWREFHSGYPFSLGTEGVKIPVMALNEMLAEKLVSWWLFGHAKHYADIAFISGLLAAAKFNIDPAERSDVLDLIELKIEANRKLHKGRVMKLTAEARRQRLHDPDANINPKRGWDTVSYIGTSYTPGAMKTAVGKVLIPFLFDPLPADVIGA